jgi:hypothetical protein
MTYNSATRREPFHDFAKKRSSEKAKFTNMKPKIKRWSHQDDLQDLVGKTIYVRFIDGEAYEGVLLNADQYVLKIQLPGVQFPVVVYKSSLTDYRQSV